MLVVACFLLALFSDPIARARDDAKKDNTEAKELASLQGTWNFVFYEEKGVKVEPGTRQFVISDKSLTFRSGGVDRIETTIEIDPSKTPKAFTQNFKDGQLYQSIYILADDYLLLCGHRDKTKRPTEFSCGEDSGGEFLILLKREP